MDCEWRGQVALSYKLARIWSWLSLICLTDMSGHWICDLRLEAYRLNPSWMVNGVDNAGVIQVGQNSVLIVLDFLVIESLNFILKIIIWALHGWWMAGQCSAHTSWRRDVIVLKRIPYQPYYFRTPEIMLLNLRWWRTLVFRDWMVLESRSSCSVPANIARRYFPRRLCRRISPGLRTISDTFQHPLISYILISEYSRFPCE